MNKIIFIAFAGMLCICASCNNTPVTTGGDSGKDSTVQINLAAFDIVRTAFQTGDASKIDVMPRSLLQCGLPQQREAYAG